MATRIEQKPAAAREFAGLSPDQLREAIMLTATIAGFPPAMNAMATLKSVLADRDRSVGREGHPEDRA